MNKIKILIALLFLTLTGCEDYLDKAPELGLTEEDVFMEYESARGFLDVNYLNLIDIHAWDNQDLRNYNITSLSDETSSMTVAWEQRSILTLNAGQWLNQPNMGEVGWKENAEVTWTPVIARAFKCLRINNKVIENAETIPNLSQEELNELLGQAYFFRAWWYFQIIQRWGGMPIFDKVLSPSDDLDLPRLTYQESTDWMISDLDMAVDLLPHTWGDIEFGRATKASALALKSMAALYAASPLMKNGLNTIQNNGYDKAWAERAAEYAHDAIEYVKNGTGGHHYRLMDGDEYEHIFYSSSFASDESLWFKLDGASRIGRDIWASYLPRRIANINGRGDSAMNYSNPTQNIVDMFETLDGYPIDHPSSTYDPQNPFENRDPRLANNILTPGDEFGVNNANKKMYLETYVDGTDYDMAVNTPSTSSMMISGYMNQKFVWPEANGYTEDKSKYSLNTVYIRVSQLYLDYAEAMNEAYGPSADPKGYGLTAVDAINIIRNRVGMPDVLAEYTGSADAFRDRIRNERAVELMFENHRWFDLRRWMTAVEVFEKPIQGIRAYPPNGHRNKPNKSNLDFTYEVIDLTTEQRVFTPRQYWYPVAQDHVENLYNFTQNPGW